MDIGPLFSAFNFVVSVAGYLGIIESLGYKIDKLTKSEFDAGVRALDQAKNSDFERKSLLREARGRFNKSIGLEKFDRLVLSYLGLALAHYHLGDEENSRSTLKKASELEFKMTRGDWILFAGGLVSGPLSTAFIIKSRLEAKRKKRAKDLVESIQEYLE